MLCSCRYIQRWKRRLQMLLAVDPTSTHEFTTPVLSGHPVGWILILAMGTFLEYSAIGGMLARGTRTRWKSVSCWRTIHPRWCFRGWPVPFGWRRETQNSMKKCVLSRYHPSIVVRSFVRGACSHVTLATASSNVFRGSRRFRRYRKWYRRFSTFGRISTSHSWLIKRVSWNPALPTLQKVVPTILYFRTHLKVTLLIDQEVNFTICRMLHYTDRSFLGPSRIVALESWALISHEAGPSARLVDNRVLKLRVVCSFLDLSQRMQPG
jgi:hypothetical protein